MTKLAVLRHQLASLRRWRQIVRLAAAAAGPLIAILWALGLIFALDVVFELIVIQRAIVILLAICGVGLVSFLLALPFLLSRAETEVEMALLVERQQQIDSDLVAALQFESPGAAAWGSRELEVAVIDYVAQVGSGLNVFAGFSKTLLLWLGCLLAASLLIACGVVLVFPEYAEVFLNRLLLGSDSYPTATIIERIEVNGKLVFERRKRTDIQPADVTGPQGQSVQFTVHCSGSIPEKELGQFVLISVPGSRSRGEVKVELKQVEFDPERRTAIYSGRLSRLADEVEYEIAVGDAQTLPARLKIVPLPIVEFTSSVTAPVYARSAGQKAADPHSRQLAVLEGSAVEMSIKGANKPLAKAWLHAKVKENGWLFPLTKQDAEGNLWKLPDESVPFKHEVVHAGESFSNFPDFSHVASEIRFEVSVEDVDGLRLDEPLHGHVRIKLDRPPTGSASVVHKVVHPASRLRIDYRANDDYGIAGISIHTAVERAKKNASPESTAAGKPFPFGDPPPPPAEPTPAQPEATAPAEPVEHTTSALPLPQGRILSPNLPASGYHELSLASLALPKGPLVKGDRLMITLEVVDYRGEETGVSHLSDPLILEVLDESDVLKANLEADVRSEEKLTDIIKQQLGIGGEQP